MKRSTLPENDGQTPRGVGDDPRAAGKMIRALMLDLLSEARSAQSKDLAGSE